MEFISGRLSVVVIELPAGRFGNWIEEFGVALLVCDWCGSEFEGMKRKKTCGDECARLRVNAKNRAWRKSYKDKTGRDLSARYRDRPYNANYNYRERHPDRAKLYDHVRRARMANCERESFSDSEIFERDGFVCGICDEPVDMGLKFPDSMSASLDHVIPLSRGGGHVRANVRLAHLGCNARKCARLDDEVVIVD